MIWLTILTTLIWVSGILFGWFLRRLLVNTRMISQLRSERAELDRFKREDAVLKRELDLARQKWRGAVLLEMGLYDQLEEAVQKRDVH